MKIAAMYHDRLKEEACYNSHCQCRGEITFECPVVKQPLHSALWLRPNLGRDLLLPV